MCADSIKTDEQIKLSGDNERVLLVEDDPAMRELAAEYLKSFGYDIYSAEDAEQAMAILTKDSEIDLLFSDVVMPGEMDGFTLAVKAKQLCPDIKVLLATGYTSLEAYEHSNTVEADEILYKPYTRSILAQRIRRVMEKK